MIEQKHESQIDQLPKDLLLYTVDYLSLKELLGFCLICREYKTLIADDSESIDIFDKFVRVFYTIESKHETKASFNFKDNRTLILSGLRFFNLAKDERNKKRKFDLLIKSAHGGNSEAIKIILDNTVGFTQDQPTAFDANILTRLLINLSNEHSEYGHILIKLIGIALYENLSEQLTEDICQIFSKFILSKQFLNNIEYYTSNHIDIYINFAMSNHAALIEYMPEKSAVDLKIHEFYRMILQLDMLKFIANQSVILTKQILENIDLIGVETFKQTVMGTHSLCSKAHKLQEYFIDELSYSMCTQKDLSSMRGSILVKGLLFDRLEDYIIQSELLPNKYNISKILSNFIILLHIPIFHENIPFQHKKVFPLLSHISHYATLHYLKHSSFQKTEAEWLKKQLQSFDKKSEKLRYEKKSDYKLMCILGIVLIMICCKQTPLFLPIGVFGILSLLRSLNVPKEKTYKFHVQNIFKHFEDSKEHSTQSEPTSPTLNQ